jgi:hypothetical protein
MNLHSDSIFRIKCFSDGQPMLVIHILVFITDNSHTHIYVYHITQFYLLTLKHQNEKDVHPVRTDSVWAVTICCLRTELFWVITERLVVIFLQRFGTTLNPRDGTQNVGRKLPLLPVQQCRISWNMRMGMRGCSNRMVGNYHYLLRKNPEQCSSQLLRGRSLKSGNVLLTNDTVAIV